MQYPKFGTLVLSAFLSLSSLPAGAEIRIGQTTGITGPVAASVADINLGAKLYLDDVNADGGIAGQSIDLVTLDDKNQPDLSLENAKKLVADSRVVALFLNRGTPHTQAIMPVLEEARIVLLAPSSGAMVLHQPVNPWIFNVRTTYQAESERLARHLGMTGIEQVGLCYVNDSFGTDAMQGALKVFKAAGKTPAVSEPIDKTKPDYTTCIKKLVEKKQLAVIMIGSPVSVAAGIKALRIGGGSSITVGTLSNNASTGFVNDLGRDRTGVIVSQVFPSERHLATPMIAEASRLAAAKGIKELTPAMIEGYAAAKVLVAGLRKAAEGNGQITRASFKRALEALNHANIGGGVGGVELTYGPNDHSGLAYVDLSFISDDGTFRR
ncbi:ABC transporter substrate-binding protein [Ideonella sp. YS5]|uniref:ABC transporter substrate-binding protein n=1 Tax=Ideonella sp. YS5 TaxID=3453714 RepID=UPI003EEC6AD5